MFKTLWLRMLQYWDLYFVDHGFLRTLYSNLHRLPGNLLRSNQPSPSQLKRVVNRFRLRTVVTLRGGEQPRGWYQLEKLACERLRVNFDWMKVYSRGLLEFDDLLLLKTQIEALELPALVHCKSGADRAGFVAVLYRHFRLGEPIEDSLSELTFRYGHFSKAKTGVLDLFFLTYLAERKRGQTLMSWAEQRGSIKTLEQDLPDRTWANLIVDTLLRRE